MATRTVKVYGNSTKNGDPAIGQITATLNGQTVFSGNVPTADPTVLFTFEVDMALDGSIPMSLEIQNSDVFLGGMVVNYCNLGPAPYDPPSPPGPDLSSGPDEFQGTNPMGDSRANVTCTGAAYCSPPPPNPRPVEQQGTWSWQVNTNGSTPAIFGYDLIITAGVE